MDFLSLPTVLELEPGRARVSMRDRRRVRNPLRSIHAIALINLGELTTVLALTTACRPGCAAFRPGCPSSTTGRRAARSRECACDAPEVPATTGPVDYEVHGAIRDAAEQMVARVTARWRLERT